MDVKLKNKYIEVLGYSLIYNCRARRQRKKNIL